MALPARKMRPLLYVRWATWKRGVAFMQVHGAQSVVDVSETEIDENQNCGVLAFDAGQARLRAGTVVHKNHGKAQIMAGSGGTGALAGTLLVHSRAVVHGRSMQEAQGQIKAL
jgi:hypothetical protein